MTTIGIASVKGAPGVSTTALGLTLLWPKDTLCVLSEVDLAGSSAVPGWFQARRPMESAVMAYAIHRSRLSRYDLSTALTPLTDAPNPLLLQGFTSPAQAPAMNSYWADFASEVETLTGNGTAIFDLGRLRMPEDPRGPLLRRLDQLVLTSGTSLPDVAALREAVAYLRPWLEDGDGALSRVSLLVIGQSRTFGANQIASACGIELLGRLPFDPVHAEQLSLGTQSARRFDASSYAKALHATIDAITGRVQDRSRQLLQGAQ